MRINPATITGITDLFAKTLHAENIYADTGSFRQLTASSTLTSGLCVDDICVTRDQFKAMVESVGASSQSAAAASDNSPVAPTSATGTDATSTAQ